MELLVSLTHHEIMEKVQSYVQCVKGFHVQKIKICKQMDYTTFDLSVKGFHVPKIKNCKQMDYTTFDQW